MDQTPGLVVTRRRGAFLVVRVMGAILTLVAIIVTFRGSWSNWRAQQFADRATLVVNFFSYFTIDANLAGVATFITSAALLIRRVLPEPGWFTVLRAAAVVYLVITGVVYNLLLRGIPVTAGGNDQAWTNEVVHVVGPILVVLDWLLAPGRNRLAWRAFPVLLAFPLAWVSYTMVRGPRVYDQVQLRPSWYPYPFLNPASFPGGYGTVAIYLVVITVAFAGVAAGVIASSRRADHHPPRTA